MSEPWVTQREIDQRFTAIYELIKTKDEAVAKALELHSTQLKEKLVEMNEIRGQILTERAEFSKREWVENQFTAIDATLKAQIATIQAEFKNDMATIRSDARGTSTSVRVLENSSNIMAGRDLGLIGAGLTIGGIIVGILVKVFLH